MSPSKTNRLTVAWSPCRDSWSTIIPTATNKLWLIKQPNQKYATTCDQIIILLACHEAPALEWRLDNNKYASRAFPHLISTVKGSISIFGYKFEAISWGCNTKSNHLCASWTPHRLVQLWATLSMKTTFKYSFFVGVSHKFYLVLQAIPSQLFVVLV